MAKSSETIYIDGSLVYNCILETDTYWHKMYVFVSMFAFFCLPLIVLMLVYWLISRRLIRENLAMSTTTSLATNESIQHQEVGCQNEQQFQNNACCCNDHNINKGKIRTWSFRKAASFKHSVSTLLTSRPSITTAINGNEDHYQQTNQMAAQTDLVGVDKSAQNGSRSNKSPMKRTPKLKAEKALSLDHHLMAKAGCIQLLEKTCHHHDNSNHACDLRSRDQVRNADFIQHQQKVEGTNNNDGIPERKQHQQQVNIVEFIKSSSPISSELLCKFMYRLFGLRQTAGGDSPENKQSTSDELTHSTSCCRSSQEEGSRDDLKKLTSDGHKSTEANEFLMESIREELQTIDYDEKGNEVGRKFSHFKNNSTSGSDQNHDQKVPFLSQSTNNFSTKASKQANDQSSIENSNNYDPARCCNGTVDVVADDDDDDEELGQANRKMRILGNTAENILNGAKGKLRFKWSRQTSVSASNSISNSMSNSTQTNSSNLPSESSVDPLSRCDLFNNSQQQFQARSILNSNGSDCNTDSNTGAVGCNRNSASQIVSNSFTPDQTSPGGLNDSCEQNQYNHVKSKNRHKLFQRKSTHIESSLSPNTVPDPNAALMFDLTYESSNNQDPIICNSTSYSATTSSSSPYSSKSSSPNSFQEYKKQHTSTRLELNNKQYNTTTNNSSSSSYKDLLEDPLLEAEEDPSPSAVEKSDRVLNKNSQIIDSGYKENELSDTTAERIRISTEPLASSDFKKLANTTALFQTIIDCDIGSNEHLQNENSEHNYTITHKQQISEQRYDIAVEDKYNVSGGPAKDLTNRIRNNSLDLNRRNPSTQDSISKCCNLHNQSNHNHHQHHLHFSFTKRPYWSKRKTDPVVCNHFRQNKTHLNELLVVQDLSKKQQMDSRRQVVIMLAFVVTAFFLLFFPYRVFTIWLILSTEDQVQSLGMETYYNLTYFSRILIYLHSAINPIAYNLISTKFRRAFMSILLCHGSSDRRYFTTEHRIVNKKSKPRNNSISDHKKSFIANGGPHPIRSPR